MKEDDLDDEVPEDDDPHCPTIPFTSMEKQRYPRKWHSSLIVKSLGTDVSIPCDRPSTGNVVGKGWLPPDFQSLLWLLRGKIHPSDGFRTGKAGRTMVDW
ncbi:unnamed protein product [Linum trigynum]|uniref:Uncharacterized protein n=1 Tax=Linum trigynum TaxID=586398 RepID=A0AAV2CW11_9ROSI